MVNRNIPKAICGSPDRPLRIGSKELPCYVLEDGKRVLVQGGMLAALNMKQGTAGRGSGDRIAKFINTKAIKPWVPSKLADMIIQPIKFTTPAGSIAYGYEATILADLCEAVLDARKNGKLHYQQVHIADQCEILLRGFVRVGIIALVDEATGYQEVRDRNELHRILEAYIEPELLPYTKKFPPEYYRQLFRLQGWTYSPLSVKRPKLLSKITVDLIYDRLPPGVKEELQKNKNPYIDNTYRRKYKHFQFLTDDIGIPHLDKLLAVATAFLKIAPNWRKFQSMYNRAVPKPGTTMSIPFPEKDDEVIDV